MQTFGLERASGGPHKAEECIKFQDLFKSSCRTVVNKWITAPTATLGENE